MSGRDPTWAGRTNAPPDEPPPPGVPADEAPTRAERGPPSAPDPDPADADRYVRLEPLGVGGMGEVWRVSDRRLGRTVARKVLKAELAGHRRAVARFEEEAQIAAQLQHPGIPPVHDVGRFPDGRPWFTMKEVRGRTFGEVIDAVHRGEHRLERAVDALARAADAVGYAHERGVLHRDLKPANLMLGEHGEVHVLDWGIAKVLGGDPGPDREDGDPVAEPVRTGRSQDRSLHTRVGAVTGTYAYMSPEQAAGRPLDARADVYALGAVLSELVTPPPPDGAADGAPVARPVEPVPTELAALVAAATAHDPAARPRDGRAFAAALRAFLDGEERAAVARGMVARADALGPEGARLRAEAAAARAAGETLLAAVPKWADETEKLPGWALVDRSEALVAEARARRLEAEALLDGALTHAPRSAEVHARLVAHHAEVHADAERTGDADARSRAAFRLRAHAEALPSDHPWRLGAIALLQGTGALTLVTDPPGAVVELYRYEPRGRRLAPVRHAALGTTPLVRVAVPMGRWLCVIRASGRHPVRYPIAIGRGEHWDGVPPGAGCPEPIRLPARDELGPDDIYVPAGWFRAGGDPLAGAAMAARRLWCDAFVIRRFPVTHGELGLPGDARLPAILLDFQEASAIAARAGWRLPGELEWEKAARGVDGRPFPWGDAFDPSFCCVGDSHPGEPGRVGVDTFPADDSPYGVRGLAGNVRDWCADAWTADGPPCPGDRVEAPVPGPPGSWRVRRGGSYGDPAARARLADRDWYAPTYRYDYLGVRLCRSLA